MRWGLDKPIDWEEMNYESLRNLAVLSAIETYETVMNMQESESDQAVTLMSIIGYLQMENAAQWIMLTKEYNEHKKVSAKRKSNG
jgi:hypothetical protein